MAFHQPKHPEQLLEVLPKNYDETLRMTRQYGNLLFAADRSGDEQLVRDVESVLIHLRYRLVQYSTTPPSYEDLMFVRIFEASFPKFVISPVYAACAEVTYEDTCMVPCALLAEPVHLEQDVPSAVSPVDNVDDAECASVVSELSELDAEREFVDSVSDLDTGNVVEYEGCDLYSYDEVSIETLTLRELEQGFENSQLSEYFYHSYLDTYQYEDIGCSDAVVACDLPRPVKTVADRVCYELLYQSHHGQASCIEGSRRARGVRRSEHFIQCPEVDLSLLMAVSSLDVCHYEEDVLFYKYNHTRDVSSLNDLAMRAYVRGRPPVSDPGSGCGI